MAKRIGIACDLEVRKWELEQEFKNTRNWRSTEAFDSKKEAQEWEKEMSAKLNCKTVEPGKMSKKFNAKWYGFVFEHDGPK